MWEVRLGAYEASGEWREGVGNRGNESRGKSGCSLYCEPRPMRWGYDAYYPFEVIHVDNLLYLPQFSFYWVLVGVQDVERKGVVMMMKKKMMVMMGNQQKAGTPVEPEKSSLTRGAFF